MPTYEYRCSRGHTFELFQKMSDPPAAACPECGSPAERVVSAAARRGVLVGAFGPHRVRAVTHLDVHPDDVVPAAEASAERHSSWPVLPMPIQSTAQSTIGRSEPRITTPRALSGSTIRFAGVTAPSDSGAPRGGVTSA